jgi:hypothetical protein
MKEINKNIDKHLNDLKSDIKDNRREGKEMNFDIKNSIDDLNNKYFKQKSERNQDKKIIQNEVKINDIKKTLNILMIISGFT